MLFLVCLFSGLTVWHWAASWCALPWRTTLEDHLFCSQLHAVAIELRLHGLLPAHWARKPCLIRGDGWESEGKKNEGIKDLQREEVKEMFQGEMILSFWWILPHRHDIHIGIKRLSIWNISLVTELSLHAPDLQFNLFSSFWSHIFCCCCCCCLSVCLFVCLFVLFRDRV